MTTENKYDEDDYYDDDDDGGDGDDGDDDRSLGNELSALLRVIWSGKWAVVSPHQMLSAVWAKMPFFKGYTQHDAQEFLRWAVGRKLHYILVSPARVSNKIYTSLLTITLCHLHVEWCNVTCYSVNVNWVILIIIILIFLR